MAEKSRIKSRVRDTGEGSLPGVQMVIALLCPRVEEDGKKGH